MDDNCAKIGHNILQGYLLIMKIIRRIITTIIAILFVLFSINLLKSDYIKSNVLSRYQGVFSTSSVMVDDVIVKLSNITNINLTSIRSSLNDTLDGAIGPEELYNTSSEISKGINGIITLTKQLTGSETLPNNAESGIDKVLNALLIYRYLYLIVLVLAGLQIVIYIIKGPECKIPLLFIAQLLMSGTFVVIYILYFKLFKESVMDLGIVLTPYPYIALIAALPFTYIKRFITYLFKIVLMIVHHLKNKLTGKKRILVLGIISIIVLLFFDYHFYYYNAYIFRKSHERDISTIKTSTSAIYSDKQIKELLNNYNFGKNYDIDKIIKDSYIIPGLYSTRSINSKKKLSSCTSMTPQGVCIAKDYLLISAYCSAKEHNSVIYVIDKNTHKFIKEVVLPGKPHVGGITFDNIHNNVWICGYDGNTSTAFVNCITLRDIKNYSLDESHKSDKTYSYSGAKPLGYTYSYPVYSINRASFLDYNDGILYVGNFVSNLEEFTTIQAFEIDSNGALKEGFASNIRDQIDNYLDDVDNDRYETVSKKTKKTLNEAADYLLSDNSSFLMPYNVDFINGGAQGFTIENDVAIISQSGGPSDSKLMEFSNSGKNNDIIKTTKKAKKTYILPPMLEQISTDEGKLYLCFESGSYAYRGRLNPIVDRILVIDY